MNTVISETKKLAHNIIDLVEDAIRKNHPEVEKLASKCEGNTLLHGEIYYDLENRIVEEIENDYSDANAVMCENCDGKR